MSYSMVSMGMVALGVVKSSLISVGQPLKR